MPARATAEFAITSWEAAPYDEDIPGPKMTRTVVNKTFTGALAGASVAELLTCESESGSAGYLAMAAELSAPTNQLRSKRSSSRQHMECPLPTAF